MVYKPVICLLAFFITLSNIQLQNSAFAFPGDKPAIIVEPSPIRDPSLGPGSKFWVNITVYNVTTTTAPQGLYGIEVRLTWNSTILKLISVNFKIGKTGGVLNPPYFTAKNETGDGYYWVAVSSLPPAQAWFGNGLAFAVQFKVQQRGKTGINLEFTDLVDGTAVPLNHYKKSGIFDNRLQIPKALVAVDPSRIVDSSITSCQNFSVNIAISNAEYLKQFSFELDFNSTVIEALEANWIQPAPSPSINNEEGKIQGSITLNPSLSGKINILTIKFHVLQVGESPLHIKEVTLIDEWGDPLNFETADGYFNNMLMTRIFVYPAELIDPTLQPGDPVTFQIKVENSFNLYICSFKLGYNKDVITFVGAIANFSLGFVRMDQTVVDGTLQINLTYYRNPINIGTATTVVTIYFQISGYGSSVLDLFDTQLIDSDGSMIPHQSEDGFLMTVIRDIAVIEIMPHPVKVYSGRNVNVNVTVANFGLIAESFTVSLYYDEVNLIGMLQIINLEPGENITVHFTWNTNGLVPCTTHILTANVTRLPYELNYENNVLACEQTVKIKMLGDVDGDGRVGLTDLVIIGQVYGSTPSSPNWVPDADLDGDNKVGLTDLVTCGFLYDEKC
jgi:hypothetical protein